MVVLSNVVVELGPEACGEFLCLSAFARPEGRADSERVNDFSLADLIDNTRPTAEVKEVISAARGLEMALGNASEAVSVLANPIASVTVLGTHPGSGTGDEVQSSLMAIRPSLRGAANVPLTVPSNLICWTRHCQAVAHL